MQNGNKVEFWVKNPGDKPSKKSLKLKRLAIDDESRKAFEEFAVRADRIGFMFYVLRLSKELREMKLSGIHDFLDRIGNFGDLPFIEQVKYLAYIYLKTTGASRFRPKNINECFESVHLSKPTNTHAIISRLVDKRVFIRKGDGYAIHRTHFKRLESEFVGGKPKRRVSKTLRSLLPKIADDNENKGSDHGNIIIINKLSTLQGLF